MLRFSLLVAGLILFQQGGVALALGPVDETALRSAYALYTQQKYAASADAFEALIRTSTPNARLYYYAASANKSCNRNERAKQLCQYVVANFSASSEAGLAQKMFPELAGNTAGAGAGGGGSAGAGANASAGAGAGAGAGASDGLPDSLKGKRLEELMQTEEGRKTLKEALSRQKAAAGSSPTVTTNVVATAAPSKSPSIDKSKTSSHSARSFTAADIAADGENGVSQFIGRPECCFECSMEALASLPRGQELLADMIRPSQAQGTYTVQFPGEGVDYTISPKKMEECRVRDKALWATLIHCALFMKMHNASELNVEDVLSWLTGHKAEKLFAANTTEQTLTRFIEEALNKHHPIVCETGSDLSAFDELVESDHDYTITDFDPGSGMITIRNPHAANSRRFRLKTDPEHKKFEQLNDGVFKMHVSTFPKYFRLVVRSSI